MDELPVAAAHDSNCLKVPQGYKKHKPKGFNTGNVMIDKVHPKTSTRRQQRLQTENRNEFH